MQPPIVLLLPKATNSSRLLSSLRTIEATAAPNRAATPSRSHRVVVIAELAFSLFAGVEFSVIAVAAPICSSSSQSHKLISSPLFSENNRSHRSPQSCSHRIPPPQHPVATASLSSPSSPSLCSPVMRPLLSPLLAFHLATGNKLTGNIPQTYVKGNALHWIDFSSNKLYGQLPRTLVNCRMLEFLENVSIEIRYIDLSLFLLSNKGVVMDYLGGQYLCGHEVPALKLKQCWHGLKYLWFVLVQLAISMELMVNGFVKF
ncbi:hypothetical protein AHAS_Ahas03G0139600 [Arachis hypogaea]